MARPNKGLSENKERYKYKRVMSVDGSPVPHLYQCLDKYYARIALPKGGKIIQTIIPLKVETLQEAISKTMQLIGESAEARAIFKTEQARVATAEHFQKARREAIARARLRLKRRSPKE